LPELSDDDDDDDDIRKSGKHDGSFVSDFEVMLQKKKEENSYRRRKRKDVDIINDNDDLIADLLTQMKQAAEDDRELNRNRQAATKKLKLLTMVQAHLRKQDLKVAFLDQGVFNVLTDWLAPLPDRSLPHLQIREALLKVLQEFPPVDRSLLKSSGIGKAVMYLYKHPKETKINRERAGKLINEWARPIFNVSSNFKSISREEREQRDFEHMPKKMRLSLEESSGSKSQDLVRSITGEDKALRPGDPGWIARARVPLPSTKDYVVRPKWNVDTEFVRGGAKKSTSRLDKHMRALAERRKLNKSQRAITISIEGRKMAL